MGDGGKKELNRLDPKKRLVRKVFRRYSKEDEYLVTPAVSPEEDLGEDSVQEQEVMNHFIEGSLKERHPVKAEKKEKPKVSKERKEILFDFGKHLNKIVIPVFVIVLLIVLLLFFIPLSKAPRASFIDLTNGEPIAGNVYFNKELIGETGGVDFNGLPREYCKERGVLKLEKDKEFFEWKTNPLDCDSKKMVFYVERYKKEALQRDIVLKFLDTTGSFYVKGKLYFDDVFVKEVGESLAISEEICRNITKIKLEHGDSYDEWKTNPEICKKGEIKFKVSS